MMNAHNRRGCVCVKGWKLTERGGGVAENRNAEVVPPSSRLECCCDLKDFETESLGEKEFSVRIKEQRRKPGGAFEF